MRGDGSGQTKPDEVVCASVDVAGVSLSPAACVPPLAGLSPPLQAATSKLLMTAMIKYFQVLCTKIQHSFLLSTKSW